MTRNFTRFNFRFINFFAAALMLFAGSILAKPVSKHNLNTKLWTHTAPPLITPTITFSSTFSPKSYGTADFVAATSTSNATITYSTDDPTVATIVNGKVHITGVGSVNITASQAANAQYDAAMASSALIVNQASPTITFSSTFSPKTYGIADFVAATANFAAPITFTSDNPAVATIVNGKVHLIGSGTANITATVTASAQYAGTSATTELTVNKASPVITFNSTLSPKTYGIADFVAATATSGAPITFTTDNSGVATIVNGKVHLVAPGTVNITATTPDNEKYNGATASASLTINQASPVITFSPTLSPKAYGTANFVAATATSGAPITFTTDDPSIATVVSGRIHLVAPGTVNITATTPNNAQYVGATATASLTVNRASPVITFSSSFTPRVYGTADFVPATATFGAPISYTSDNLAVASIVNGRVHLIAPGTVHITATTPDNTLYVGATSSATLTVTQSSPTITFISTLTPRTYGTADFVAATATLGAPITYTTDDPTIATVVNGKIHLVAPGTVNITATTPNNAQYTGATASASLTVNQASPTITFVANLSPRAYSTTDFVPATATFGAPIVLTTDDPTIATIVNGKVHMVGPGTVNITATTPNNAQYAGASASAPLTITQANQTITFNTLASKTYGDPDITLTATSTNHTIPVTYSSTNTLVAIILSGKIHIVGAGTTNIVASQAGNANFAAAADVQQQFTVNQKSQTISFATLSAQVYAASDFHLTSTSTSGLPVSYTSSDPDVATVTGDLVHIVGLGSTIITASQTGNTNYAAATDVPQQLTVNQASQTITGFAAIPAKTFGDADFTVSATASSGLAVTFTSSDPDVATVTGTTVHIVGAGNANIIASQTGNANYTAATDVTQALSVGQANQTITGFAAIPAKTFGDADFTVSASASSGLAVTFTSSDPAVATVTGTTVHIVGAGNANIIASQPGNANYTAATDVTQALSVGQLGQTITGFAAIPAKTFGDADFTVSASASSGLTVTFTSSDPAVATVTGTTVHIVGAGNANIIASQPGNANYAAATDVTQALSVGQLGQTITFDPLPSKPLSSSDFTLGATASSNLTVTYISSNTAVATVTGTTVHIVGLGSTIITASQTGNTNYAAAADVTQQLDVVSNSQTISGFAAIPAKTFGDADFTVSASASSGLTVTFTSSDPAVATVTGTTVHIVGAGNANIIASQAGNASFAAAPDVTQALSVGQLGQTISGFAAIPAKTFGDADFTVSASASSGLTVTFTSSDPAVATVTGTTVHIVGAGNANIIASQPGNTNYTAATDVTQALSVGQAGQAITFNTLSDKAYNAPDFNLAGSASSGLTVTYTSSDPAVATVSGNTVHITGVGSTTITASQTGNTNYTAATDVPQQLDVNQASQTITGFAAIPAKTFGDADFTVSATASSGLAVTFTSSDPDVATVTGTTVHIVGAGNANIIASQTGNANYTAATDVTQALSVGQANQTITGFAAIPAKTFGDADFTVSASASSGLAVTFTSSDPAVATVTGTTVHIVGAGNANIIASQTGNANYTAATDVTQALNVGQASQTITFSTLPSKAISSPDFTLSATATSNLPVTFASSNPAVATVSGTTVTIVGVGTTNITASQAGNTNYAAATAVTRQLNVVLNSQTITGFAAIPAKTTTDADFTVSASASSGLTVTFTSDNTLVATVSGNTVHIVGAGSAHIIASQTGDGTYAAATSVSQLLNVTAPGLTPQTISGFTAIPAKNANDADFTVNASASSGLPVTFTSDNTLVATVSGNTVHITGAGNANITASQAGDGTYAAATPVSQLLTVNASGLTPQSITNFAAIPAKTASDADFTISALATSGLAVTFTSSDPAVATVSGNTVHIVGAGSANIIASQAGNATYAAATSVSQPLSVAPVLTTQTISGFAAIPAKTFGDADFTVSASASSGLTVTFTSSDPAVATVTGTTVHIVGAGNANIIASQAGNANYAAATDVTQALSVGQASQTITFSTLSSKALSSPDFNLSATASSNLTVTYTSSDPAVATISGNTVHITGLGSTNITASQTGNTNYAAATPVTHQLDVVLNTQTISGFAAIPAKTFGAADFTVSASASSGLTVTFTSSDPTVATVTGTTVHIVGAGNANIIASQAGNATYAAAADVTQALNVGQASQTITFITLPSKAISSPDFTLSATATSNLPVTFASSNTAVATVSGTTVHIIGVGSTNIIATQSGNINYVAAADVTQQLDVVPNSQTITGFATIPAKTTSDADFTVSASASSGLAVTFTSDNSAVATVSGNTVHIVGAGNANIIASQAGNGTYATATPVSQPLTITASGLTPQNITFNTFPAKNTGDADFSANASASSGLGVVLSSDNAAVATIVGGNIHIVGAGSANITASQSGNTTYAAATPVSRQLTVTATGLTAQTITGFVAIAAKTYGDADFSVNASASSGLPVTFTSDNTAVATVSGTTVHIVGSGSANIIASQAGNTTYAAAASVSQPLSVGQAGQTITFNTLPAKTYGDLDFNANATINSANAIAYTSSNLSVATVNNQGVIHVVGAGSTIISANQAGNANYLAAPQVNQPLNVAKGSLVVTADDKTKIRNAVNPPLTVSYAGFAPGDNASSLTTQPTATTVATTTSAAGDYPIVPAGGVSTNYNFTYVNGTLTISKGILLITADNKSKTYGDANPALTVTYSGFLPGDNVANSISTPPTLETLAGTASNAGNYTIAAFGAVSSNGYIINYATGTLTINKAIVNITADDKTKTYGTANPVFTASYSAFVNGDNESSISTLPVITTVATTNSPVGSYPIVPGGAVAANYNFSYTNGNLTVTQAVRNIVFNSLPAKTYGDADFDAGATATSGETVTYTSSNTAVATIVSGKIHIVGTGNVTITASVPVNSNYSNNPTVSQLLIVNKAIQIITFAIIPTQNRGGSYDLSVIKSNSGLPVTITTNDPMIASITGQTLNALRIGMVHIVASQAGNANYLPATISQDVFVQDPAGNEIIVHQAMSPNGDGINDVLYIEGIGEHPSNRVTLIDRNGVKVYEINGYDNSSKAFDGHSNLTGSKLQPGTYFYLVEYTVGDKGRHLTGYFVLKY